MPIMENYPPTGTEIYFDCNATTPVHPLAANKAMLLMQEIYGNPSSIHPLGVRAKNMLQQAREYISAYLCVKQEQLILNSGATEGIQTAIFSALYVAKQKLAKKEVVKPNILYASTEHKAVIQALEYWNRILGTNFVLVSIPVNIHGLLDLNYIENQVENAHLVCTMAVNNETGVIQDLQAISHILGTGKSARPLWLVDCVQAIGKITVNLERLKVDYAVFSGHKLYAPKGVGLLYLRDGVPYFPLIVGGGQEAGNRSGTENITAAVAMGEVFYHLQSKNTDIFWDFATLCELRTQILDALQKAFPNLILNSAIEHSIPTTINFTVPGILNHELLQLFASIGVYISSGSACNSEASAVNHVLSSMGISPELIKCTVRLSFGPGTSKEQISEGCKRILQLGEVLHKKNMKYLLNSCTYEKIILPQTNLPIKIFSFHENGKYCYLILNTQNSSCLVIDKPHEKDSLISDEISIFLQVNRVSHVQYLFTLTQDIDDDSTKFMFLGETIGVEGNRTSNGKQELWLEKVLCQDENNTSYALPNNIFVLKLKSIEPKTANIENTICAFVGDLLVPGGIKKNTLENIVASGIMEENNLSIYLQKISSIIRIIHSKIQPTTFVFCSVHYESLPIFKWGTEISSNELLQLLVHGNTDSLENILSEKESFALEENPVYNSYYWLEDYYTHVSDCYEEKSWSEFWETVQNNNGRVVVLDLRSYECYKLFLANPLFQELSAYTLNIPLHLFQDFLINYEQQIPQNKHATDEFWLLCHTGKLAKFVSFAWKKINPQIKLNVITGGFNTFCK